MLCGSCGGLRLASGGISMRSLQAGLWRAGLGSHGTAEKGTLLLPGLCWCCLLYHWEVTAEKTYWEDVCLAPADGTSPIRAVHSPDSPTLMRACKPILGWEGESILMWGGRSIWWAEVTVRDKEEAVWIGLEKTCQKGMRKGHRGGSVG